MPSCRRSAVTSFIWTGLFMNETALKVSILVTIPLWSQLPLQSSYSDIMILIILDMRNREREQIKFDKAKVNKLMMKFEEASKIDGDCKRAETKQRCMNSQMSNLTKNKLIAKQKRYKEILREKEYFLLQLQSK